MAMHFHAGVDGEALSVQLKELQAAADLPVPVVVGVDAAAAEVSKMIYPNLLCLNSANGR